MFNSSRSSGGKAHLKKLFIFRYSTKLLQKGQGLIAPMMEFSYVGKAYILLLFSPRHMQLPKYSYTLSYLTSMVYGGVDKLRRPNGNIDRALQLHKYTWRLKESTRREKTNELRRVLKVKQRGFEDL